MLIIPIVISAGCSDKEKNNDGDDMSLSREEKIILISEIGASEDISHSDEIAKFLADEDNEVVGQACFYLGYVGGRSYIKTIISLLDTTDTNLLNFCLSGLSLMVDGREHYISENILRFVRHDDLLVRMSAIEVLGKIQSKNSLKVLMEIFNHEPPAVQSEIVRALGRIGEVDALPLLLAYKDTVDQMDHSIPRKGRVRGEAPHPDVLSIIITEAINSLQK